MSNSIAPGSSADVNVRVTALTTNPNVPAQYKTIILKKNLVNGVNTLTQAMMNQANTKYVIKYDYTLGEDITVPANCVLEFDGGSISGATNCTLALNTCYLKGLPKFNNVAFSGNIKNDMFDCTWIENGSDIGAKINYAQQYFKRLYTPGAEYIFATPIEIDINYQEEAKIYLDGIFKYSGSTANNASAVNILHGYSTEIFINRLESTITIDYNDSRTVNFVGLAVTNTMNSIIRFNYIQKFNECIRLQAIGTSDVTTYNGCSYNKVYGTQLDMLNAGIRVYQKDGNGYKGWCNEVAINISRIAPFASSFTNHGKQYAIMIAGPNADLASYTDANITDTADATSSIRIENSCLEGFQYPVYAKNVRGLLISGCREEGITGIIKAVGYIYDFHYTPNYEDKFETSEMSECSSFEFDAKHSVVVPNPWGGDYAKTIAYKNVILGVGFLQEKASSSTDSFGIIVDTSKTKIFRINRRIYDTTYNYYFNCTYLNDAGDAPHPDVATLPAPRVGAELNGNTWSRAFFVFVPASVKKVLIAAGIQQIYPNNFEIEARDDIKYTCVDPQLWGDTASRPSVLKLGVGYQNIETGKIDYYNGTDWISIG